MPPHPRDEPSHSILHYPHDDDVGNRQARSVRFGLSEIRVFEMTEPEEMDHEDPVVMEKTKDKKSKAAAHDELKELLARKQEEYKKLQAEKLKNKRQGKGKKGQAAGASGGGGAGDKGGAEKGGASGTRGLGISPSQELLMQITAANAALGKDPFGEYTYVETILPLLLRIF